MPGPIVIANTSDFPLDQAIPDVYFTRVENYILYATATLLIYEILVTFDQEVERVWSLRWRLPKFLFFLNRYVARILLMCVLEPPGPSLRVYLRQHELDLERVADTVARVLPLIRVLASNVRP
ncbi:unnamed protein product, partial [Mycena citricolor]